MSSKQRTKTGTPTKARKLPLGLILGGVFTVLLIVTVFLTLDSGESSGPDEYGSPTVEGSLGQLLDGPDDSAIGELAPAVVGQDFAGNEVSMINDGRAKMIVFLAHWCPHCQNEVPWVTEWLEDTELPESIDFYAVATSIDRNQANWPPSAWLEREGFTAPVLVDSRDDTIARAYGLPAYPYWVFVAEDGTVLGRVSGGISAADLDSVLASLLAG